MRSKPFRTLGTAWRERIVEAPAVEAQTPDPELPRGQIIHLLEVRAGGPDSLYGKVLVYLRAVGSDEPTLFDRTQLRDACYIRWNAATNRDDLLPPGQHAAEKIAKQIARDCGIHHITFNFKLPRSNTGSFASCACGGWRQTVTRKRGDDDRLRRLAAEHLDQVVRGTFKKPRPIEEFLNEYMPLRLPLGIADVRGE